MRRKTQIVLIGSGLLGLTVLVSTGLYMKALQSQMATLAWGGPSLRVSERDYFMAQMESVFQELGPQGFEGMPNRSDENDPVLAIDLDHHVLWLDPPEVPWLREGVVLPASLAWTLYYRNGDETVTLPPFVCLRPSRSADAVALVGSSRDDMHLACRLTGPGRGTLSWEDGAFDPNSLYGGEPGLAWPAMMITDEAHMQEIAQHRPNQATLQGTAPLPMDSLDVRTRNRIAWEAMQKPLYQALEKHATDQGYDVARVAVYPGPDGTAGLAGVAMQTRRPRGFWQRLFGTSVRTPRYLLFTIEADHNGHWQCRSTDAVSGSGRPGPSGRLQVDFTIQTSRVGPTAVDDPLEPSLGESKWSVFLDDGTQVELIGVYRDQGKTWWAPDGSALDDWPGFSSRRAGGSMIRHDLMSSRQSIRVRQNMGLDRGPDTDERCFAVLRVPSVTGFAGRSGSSSSGSTAVYYGGSPFIDRFGRPLFPGQYIVLRFDPQTHSTVSQGLGIYVLQNPQGRPGIIRSSSRTRGSGGVAVGGGHMAGGGIAGGMGRGTARSGRASALIPPDRSQPRTEDIDDMQLQWIRLENLSLQANQETDFQMTLSEEAANRPTAPRVQIVP